MLRSTKPTKVYAASIPYFVYLLLLLRGTLFKLLYNSLFIVHRLLHMPTKVYAASIPYFVYLLLLLCGTLFNLLYNSLFIVCRLLDVIFSTFFRFYVTKPPKKLPFNPLYTKYI